LNPNVKYPTAALDSAIASGDSGFMRDLGRLAGPREKIDDLIRKTDVKAADKQTEAEKIQLAKLKALTSRHDRFAASVIAIDESSKIPNLLSLLRGELVHDAVRDVAIDPKT
jgi:hypothetical protein